MLVVIIVNNPIVDKIFDMFRQKPDLLLLVLAVLTAHRNPGEDAGI